MRIILGLLLSLNVFASNTASIVLHGTIPAKTDVTTTVTSVNLSVEANAVDTVISTLGIKTNRPATVFITSTNSFNLVKSGFATQIPYTLKLGTTTVTASAISFPQFTNTNRDLKISYTGVDGYLMDAGDYTDTLTVTVTAL
jgi:hypothetical protein